MTKKEYGMLVNYRRATAETLFDVYTRVSKAKVDAFNYCRRLQSEMGGYGAKIPSASTFVFTYAFLYPDNNGNTCLCYITRDNKYTFVVE